MTLETDLRSMGQHLKTTLAAEKDTLLLADGVTRAYEGVVYGEPRVIQKWPMLSVQPLDKIRNLREGATRKFNLTFRINLVLYHGKVADTLDIQDGTHERAERIETFMHTDFKWNFVDTSDSTKDKVIFGYVTVLDHPVVLAPQEELWSASRLELTAMSQELF